MKCFLLLSSFPSTSARMSMTSTLSSVRHVYPLTRLYKGWTAVLCRNIPQSAIKFFVFEQLMRITYTTVSRASTSPLPTLAIGGVAGSTAALFTTPFDTIKTRLQTQGLGANQGGQVVKGVIPTMKDIVLHEGVGGLYRGVLPRLFIYVTQGAVFFTSYEMARYVINTISALHCCQTPLHCFCSLVFPQESVVGSF